MIHIDWMFGSGKEDVTGKDQNGNMVPSLNKENGASKISIIL